jgi:hypothetical protein
VTCGFDRSPKFFLTGLLGFLLGRLCDLDHMEPRGVWCRTGSCSVKAVTRDVLTVEKVGARLGPVVRGARAPAQIHHVSGPCRQLTVVDAAATVALTGCAAPI